MTTNLTQGDIHAIGEEVERRLNGYSESDIVPLVMEIDVSRSQHLILIDTLLNANPVSAKRWEYRIANSGTRVKELYDDGWVERERHSERGAPGSYFIYWPSEQLLSHLSEQSV